MSARQQATPERCPFCGRFVADLSEGFYDRLERNSEESFVACFCSESHANRYHERGAK